MKYRAGQRPAILHRDKIYSNIKIGNWPEYELHYIK